MFAFERGSNLEAVRTVQHTQSFMDQDPEIKVPKYTTLVDLPTPRVQGTSCLLGQIELFARCFQPLGTLKQH